MVPGCILSVRHGTRDTVTSHVLIQCLQQLTGSLNKIPLGLQQLTGSFSKVPLGLQQLTGRFSKVPLAGLHRGTLLLLYKLEIIIKLHLIAPSRNHPITHCKNFQELTLCKLN